MQMWLSSVVAVLSIVGAVALVDAQNGQLPQPRSLPAKPTIAVKNGLLTAQLEKVPLGMVLGELGGRTHVALVSAPELDQEPVSAQISALPLDRGLRELLKNYDTFFYYGSEGGDSAELRAVWIYARGTGALVQPVPPEAWASSRELKELLATSNPEVREQTYEALMSRPDPESQNVVLEAIRGATELDPELRQRILASAIGKGLYLPPNLLPSLAGSDGSEAIRLIALDALATTADVKDVAEAALSDPSEAVRARAAQIVGDLSAGLRFHR